MNQQIIHLDCFIDRGGTFTDIYCEIFEEDTKQEILTIKLLSEEHSYSDGPSEGIKRILASTQMKYKSSVVHLRTIIMGTTLVTNAILERKGVRCALLITKGFKDLLKIGTQTRPKIFDLTMKRPDVLYETVIEINERVSLCYPGIDEEQYPTSQQKVKIIKSLDEEEVKNALQHLKSLGYGSLSVCFLHSSIYNQHELQVKALSKLYEFENVSLSCETSSAIRAVPRGQTAVLDSYINPIILKYVTSFMGNLGHHTPNLLFMTSDGGLCESKHFIGSRALLSGPAGGVVGMIGATKRFLTKNNIKGVIGFDMGGTSTDVSVYYPESGVDVCQESMIGGIHVTTSCYDINTVAAGGGSLLTFSNGMFRVGPESSGALPGPVCYGRDGYLSLTDANLLLGYIGADHFPKIFGHDNKQPLDYERTKEAFLKLTTQINEQENTNYSDHDVAKGFLQVAIECMCRPIRSLTQGRGRDTHNHLLFIFGGAGSQVCTSIADKLSIKMIYIHQYASILSAYGLSMAKLTRESKRVLLITLSDHLIEEIKQTFIDLSSQNTVDILQYNKDYKVQHKHMLALKYLGSDYLLTVPLKGEFNFNFIVEQFQSMHKNQFGFILERDLVVECITVVSQGGYAESNDDQLEESFQDLSETTQFISSEAIVQYKNIQPNEIRKGPFLIVSDNTTVVIEEGWSVQKTSQQNLLLIKIQTKIQEPPEIDVKNDPVELSVFGNRFMSIAEQMGIILQNTAISTNIKERLDYSCALFGPDGNLIANAPHLPVHLGSMSDAVQWQKNHLGPSWNPGDVILSNHPMAGGSHLPDLTVISPCYHDGKVIFYVASRGHHADIGGISPGSMPSFSKNLQQEGVGILSFKIVEQDVFQGQQLEDLLLNPKGSIGTRTIKDNICDLQAQIAANQKGIQLLLGLVKDKGLIRVQAYMKYIQQNAEESVRKMLVKISLENTMNEIDFVEDHEFMDDGSKICLKLTINRIERSAIFDFSGTSPQVEGNTNCPSSVTKSAVIYCLRCLVDMDIPLNQGCLNPVQIILPKSSLLLPDENAAIVGGNVLTSQRITDLVLKCFKAAAASQGCMNNFSFGAKDKQQNSLSYYETIAGGCGAGPYFDGESGVQVHMTNTRITDIEIVERRYPVRVKSFHLRQNSGGQGKFNGGDGVTREFEFYYPLNVNLLMERRVYVPFGLLGGEPGSRGENLLIKKDGSIINLGGKCCLQVEIGDVISINTPGGGGFGDKTQRQSNKRPNKILSEQLQFGSVKQYQLNQEEV